MNMNTLISERRKAVTTNWSKPNKSQKHRIGISGVIGSCLIITMCYLTGFSASSSVSFFLVS
jgi:hypothetical protein